MKVMAERVTNRVSTIKIPDGQCIQTGRTLKQLFEVHSLDSRMSDESGDCQGQPNMNVNRCQINRTDWNLSRSVINESIQNKRVYMYF
jgi:hypothetical protein